MSSKRRKDGKWPFARAGLLKMLASAAVVLALAILLGSFRAPEDEAPKATLADCRAINEAQGRLACYDMLAKRYVPLPAKGGQAILSRTRLQRGCNKTRLSEPEKRAMHVDQNESADSTPAWKEGSLTPQNRHHCRAPDWGPRDFCCCHRHLAL